MTNPKKPETDAPGKDVPTAPPKKTGSPGKVSSAGKAKKKTSAKPKGTSARQKGRPVPVVGIGASAGGLEALEQFLSKAPQDSGMAFVIVQHLDPTHKGIMHELLRRVTSMEVFQVEDGMPVRPNCVYVIPPNRDMSILHNSLYLFEPKEPRGLRLPIDTFLRSLAEDRKNLSIGVILSGMGSDGTVGLRAIKEAMGLSVVQDPARAKFDSMPRSAIEAGLADLVAPAEDLPGMIFDYLRHSSDIPKTELPLPERDQSALDKILILLRSESGQDFSLYKKNTIYRRIERRMGIHQISRIGTYVRYLQENPQEVKLLFRELLIGVTNFFRDPAEWDSLRLRAIPALLDNRQARGPLRAWSVGCSTGEEAYSLAMVFKETMEELKTGQNFTLHIFATDLERDTIDRARQGFYPAGIAADVSPERIGRFFVEENGGYRISQEIREMVTFATQNVIMDPPFTRLDILVCRNLLIYMTPELQKRLLPLFHYSLNPEGLLFLGGSESINTFTNLFEPLAAPSRLYRRREVVFSNEPAAFPSVFAPLLPSHSKESHPVKPAPNLQSLADQLLLQRFSPPAVLVNDRGDIIYISGRTGAYLEPASGKANWNIFAMAREGLRSGLENAFHKALKQREPVSVRGLVPENGNSRKRVDLTVQAIEEPADLRGMVMVVFTEGEAPVGKKTKAGTKTSPVSQDRIADLEQEREHLQEELRTTREEMQSSQEELKSSNEELQSTNEELQSTNEELTTSREEMQSMNEELQTINAEQQSKLDELARLNDDMRNLLNSTEIVTVFLDNDLQVRRFTPGADRIFKLIPGDVGRPLSDITNDLLYPDMTEDVQEVLRTLAFSEKQVTTADGRWYSIRIMPYRTMSDVIAGVVITFANITATKVLEDRLRQEIAGLKERLGE